MSTQLHPLHRRGRPLHELHGELQDLLNRMAHALASGDGRGVAELWDVPAIVIDVHDVIAVRTLDQVEAFYGGTRAHYASRGVIDTRADILDEEWLEDRIVVVRVRWPYFDAAGEELGAETADYTLRRDDFGQLKVRCALMRGPEPRRARVAS